MIIDLRARFQLNVPNDHLEKCEVCNKEAPEETWPYLLVSVTSLVQAQCGCCNRNSSEGGKR